MSFKDRAIRSLGALFALMTSCAFAQDYDLSALPAYKAAQNQLGVIRVHGSQLTVNLIHRWEEDVREGNFLPLTAETVGEQLKKLDL